MKEALRIGFLAIGDELLDGRVLDSNSVFLAAAIAEQGHRLAVRLTVPDEVEAIGDALSYLAARADWIVVSGGLGPTTDDITCDVVSTWGKAPLSFDERSWNRIRSFFESRGMECPDTNRKQAEFPNGAIVLDNPIGTAPGFLLEANGVRVVALPGVHIEFKRMLEEHLLPRLLGDGRQGDLRHFFRLFGARESSLAVSLDQLPLRPEESVHYQASFPHLSVMVRSKGSDALRWEYVLGLIRETVQPWLYGEGDARIASHVVDALIDRQWTISIAESCTGGRIASLLTAIPGSSAVFNEGVVTYSNESKIRKLRVSEEDLLEHGAVSRKVVTAMAEGALAESGAHVAVATSGIAGPGGGTETKPVGTVHIALAMRGEATVHQCLNLRGNRERVQERAAWAVLKLVLDQLAAGKAKS